MNTLSSLWSCPAKARLSSACACLAEQFSPRHLADRIASPLAGSVALQDAYTIRYRVL